MAGVSQSSSAPFRRAAHRLHVVELFGRWWTGKCTCGWECPGTRDHPNDVVWAHVRHVDNARPVDWDSTAEYHDRGMP